MDVTTHSTIQAIEEDDELLRQALNLALDLLRQEDEISEKLAVMMEQSGVYSSGGRADWQTVLEYFKERAEAEIIRNEIRRNRVMAGGPRETYSEMVASALNNLSKP